MLLAAVFLLGGQPAEAGIPDAATATRYVENCIAATGAAGVSHAAIEAQGWRSMNVRSGSGKPLPMQSYSRAGDMSLLAASVAPAKSIDCSLLIPTNGSERAAALRDALSARFGTSPSGTIATEAVWTFEKHRIALTPMGQTANPAGVKIKVTVEKK